MQVTVSRTERLNKAMAMWRDEKVSLRYAAAAFGVAYETLRRRAAGITRIGATHGRQPILTEGEVDGILDAVRERAAIGHCFTKKELRGFIRTTVETSQYRRSVPVNFPSNRFVERFCRTHKSVFGARKAQTLDRKRADHSTEHRVRVFFENLETVIGPFSGRPK
jgi:hypothetical protein